MRGGAMDKAKVIYALVLMVTPAVLGLVLASLQNYG
jgi:hypothetical protein